MVLGVSGGIAAYKACALLRLLVEDGHGVTVVPTSAALEFVGRATWEALSGRSVATGVFESVPLVPHVRLGQQADLVIVAPATADILARTAAGIADDLLTATLLTARCPVLFAPAMHTEMWEHPATQHNVSVLAERGAVVLPPASGRLTGTDSGPGRLPEPAQLHAAVTAHLVADGRRDLLGRHVLVSAGGTREPLDPVRYLGNHSSGRQGYALTAAAVARGARVTLVSANVALPDPLGAQVVRVGTAEELSLAVGAAAADADLIVMAAAVADYRPAERTPTKLKKVTGGTDLALVTNPDILAGLVSARRDGQVIVGFAAETGDADGDVVEHGWAKLRRKGCDLLAVNEVGAGKAFGTTDNTVFLLAEGSRPVQVAGSKVEVAHAILDATGLSTA